jgi:hypothetical protein
MDSVNLCSRSGGLNIAGTAGKGQGACRVRAGLRPIGGLQGLKAVPTAVIPHLPKSSFELKNPDLIGRIFDNWQNLQKIYKKSYKNP